MTAVFLEATLNYTSVTLYYKNQPQLISNGPFSGEYTAGLVIGLYVLLQQEAGRNPYYTIEVISSTGSIIKFDLLNSNVFNIQISKFLVMEGVSPIDIIRNSTHIHPNQYGWWIRSSYTQGSANDLTFNLYTFMKEDFILGFLAAFANTNYDFRDYIAGPPFILNQNVVQPIIVLGYEIKDFDPLPRIPDLLVPYETMSYQSGIPHGVDYD